MEKESRSKPISIEPKNVFGLRTDILGNVHFTVKQEIIYPVAGVLAIHNFSTNKQKFLRFEAFFFIFESNSLLKQIKSLQIPGKLPPGADSNKSGSEVHCCFGKKCRQVSSVALAGLNR